jgi:hypothetical protein
MARCKNWLYHASRAIDADACWFHALRCPAVASKSDNAQRSWTLQTVAAYRDGQSPKTRRHPSTSIIGSLMPALGVKPPPGADSPGVMRTPPTTTPAGPNCSFLIRPVISILDPSWPLISAITFFGPFMRRCIPSGMGEPPGRSSVWRPAVKMRPFEQPGTKTRIEFFGTRFSSCALGVSTNIAAMAKTRTVFISLISRVDCAPFLVSSYVDVCWSLKTTAGAHRTTWHP